LPHWNQKIFEAKCPANLQQLEIFFKNLVTTEVRNAASYGRNQAPNQDERNQQTRGGRGRPYHALAEAPLQRGERRQVRLREPSASVCTHARTKPPHPVSAGSPAPHRTARNRDTKKKGGRAGITRGEAGEVDEDGGDPEEESRGEREGEHPHGRRNPRRHAPPVRLAVAGADATRRLLAHAAADSTTAGKVKEAVGPFLPQVGCRQWPKREWSHTI
jgi:hypothetical protein